LPAGRRSVIRNTRYEITDFELVKMTHRSEAMLPLTRDHHHALRQARQLRKGAESTDRAARLASADNYLNFYLGRALTHFREEEELFFPPAAALEEIRPLVSRAVMEHLSIHRLTGHLKRQLGTGEVAQELLAEISELLRLHVRFEEDELFPLIERLVPLDELVELATHRREV
jgi:hemerythrin-like domain-containing protein